MKTLYSKLISLPGIDLRGDDSGLCHFSILPNFTDLCHFSTKIRQNHEKLKFFAEKGQFFKIFGAFGAENVSLVNFGHPPIDP